MTRFGWLEDKLGAFADNKFIASHSMFCSCCGHTFKFLLPFINVRKQICHVSLFDCRVFLWLGIAVKLDKSQIRYAPLYTNRATFRANFSHRSVIGDTKSPDKYWTFSIWSIRRLRSLAWLDLTWSPIVAAQAHAHSVWASFMQLNQMS